MPVRLGRSKAPSQVLDYIILFEAGQHSTPIGLAHPGFAELLGTSLKLQYFSTQSLSMGNRLLRRLVRTRHLQRTSLLKTQDSLYSRPKISLSVFKSFAKLRLMTRP